MQRSSEQLSCDRPGFIALQLVASLQKELTLAHLRERCGLLAGYLFHTRPTSHIAAIYISSFGATSVAADALAHFGITVGNPNFRLSHWGLPFLGPDEQAFAKILNTTAASPEVNSRKVVRGLELINGRPWPTPILVKFGERKHLENLAEHGKARISCASFYSDDSLGQARSDKEHEIVTYVHPSDAHRLMTRRGIASSHMANIWSC